MPTSVLQYFGHSAFRWTTSTGMTIVVDPFDNDEARPWMQWFAAPMPLVSSDYALVTHDHFDHRAIHRVSGATTLQEACDVSRQDLTLSGIVDEHVPGHGPPHMQNVLFVVEAAGVRCCHWGDNRHDPPRHVVERLGRVDILMVPVDDSCHLLQYAEVDAIVDALTPRVIVPMHYLHPEISDERSPLRGIGGWLTRQPWARRQVEGPLELELSALPNERQIWVMEPSRGSAPA